MDYKLITPPIGKWDKVEIRQAGHKGNGVFAKKNIKKGEVLCWYDGIHLFPKDKDFINIYPAFVSGKTGYNQNIKDGEVIAGFPYEYRKGGIAQMINDYDTTADVSEINKNISEGKYNVENSLAYDSDGNFKYFYSFASRKIKAGEELLRLYGEMYWTDNERKWTPTIIKHICNDICKIEEYNLGCDGVEDYLYRCSLMGKVIKWWE